MEGRIKDVLHDILGRRVRFDCPMSEYTTFRIGGNVEALGHVHSVEDLGKTIVFLKECRVPAVVVGKGSNLLVRDEGMEGVVLVLTGQLALVRQDQKDKERVVAGGGASLSDLLVHCRNHGLSGLEFLAGIPGSVGGAMVMNAGAFGGEIGDHVEDISLFISEGRLVKRHRRDLRFFYRRLELETGSIVVEGSFRLQTASTEMVGQQIATNLKRRRETQPLEYPSAGSVFKNPPGDYAGRLIESVGLKGTRIGNAKISEEHANYIVNLGGATANDVLALMDLVKEKVREGAGIELEPEIKVMGGGYR